MPPKSMEPLARRIFKGVVLMEVLGIFAAYGLFYKMNTSRGNRASFMSIHVV